jgi:multidrug resistance protein
MRAMTAPPASPGAVRIRSPGLWVLMLTVFINLVGFGIIVPLLPFFADSLNAEPWQITLMFSAYSLGQFFAEPFWGRTSDRIGRKPVLLITLAANMVGYLLLAFAANIWVAIAVRLFTGLGAGNISTVQGYVADVTPPEQRAGRMGLLGGAFGLGFIVGPALGGLLVNEDAGRLGFQIPIFVASALAAAAFVGVLVFLRESRARAAPDAPRPSPFAALGEARANPVIARVLLVTLVYMAAFSGMESTFGLWAEARFDWHAREVGLSFMVIGCVSAVVQALVSGRLARRFGEAQVLAFGMGLFGASLLVQTLLQQAALVPVAMAFGAFGMALAMPNISALISRSTPADRQGAVLGLNMATGSLARMAGPIAAGFTFSALGPNAPYVTGGLLVIPAVLLALDAGRVFRRAGRSRVVGPAAPRSLRPSAFPRRGGDLARRPAAGLHPRGGRPAPPDRPGPGRQAGRPVPDQRHQGARPPLGRAQPRAGDHLAHGLGPGLPRHP